MDCNKEGLPKLGKGRRGLSSTAICSIIIRAVIEDNED